MQRQKRFAWSIKPNATSAKHIAGTKKNTSKGSLMFGWPKLVSVFFSPKISVLLKIAVLMVVAFLLPLFAKGEVNVYSLRQPFLIEPIFEDFERRTGIDVRIVYAKTGLAQRLLSENVNSPADLIMTVDIGSLTEMDQLSLGQPVRSRTIRRNIPSYLRSEDNSWFALTTRARVIYASKDRVPEGSLTTYEQLTDPTYKGKVCIRSGYHPYNVALFASLLYHYDEAWLEQWLRDLKGNLARKPQGNDRAQAKAIKEGLCDVALGNSYYFGKMVSNEKESEQKDWAAAIRLVFPNQDGRGTHVNVSGMLLAKYSPNKKDAIKLMEYLTSKRAQTLYAMENYEYPASEKFKSSTGLAELDRKFKRDTISLTTVGKLRRNVIFILDKVAFDK